MLPASFYIGKEAITDKKHTYCVKNGQKYCKIQKICFSLRRITNKPKHERLSKHSYSKTIISKK